MVEYPKFSKCKIQELPDYTVYVYQIEYNKGSDECYQRIQRGQAEISQYWNYYDYTDVHNIHLMEKHPKAAYGSIPVKGVSPEFGARIMLASSCNVPSTLLKQYNVITSVSTESPEYIVLPGRIWFTQYGPARFYVNEEEKVIIALIVNYYNFMDGLPDEAYIPSLYNALSMVMPEINRFKPMHLHPQFCLSFIDNEQEHMFMQNLIPRSRVISETNLFIGENRVNYDILKSCYQMLQSTDDEMKLAALYSLAQQDCHGYKELIRWMFRWNRDIVSLACSRNKPMKWLRQFVTDYRQTNNTLVFNEPSSLNAAKRLIADLTGGKVRWEGDQQIHESGYSFKDQALKILADIANHVV